MAAGASTKLLLTDFASTLTNIPTKYVRPIDDRPNLSDISVNIFSSSTIPSPSSIPVIDLNGSRSRSEVVEEISSACKKYGFFQITNHGVPDSVIGNMLGVSKEFFRLPESERMKCYSDEPGRTTRLLTSFNVKTEEVSNWRDMLRLHCHPIEDFVHEWPTNPPSFREDVGAYCKSVRDLALRLLELISESLGLDADYMNKALGRHGQHIGINYYPPCPQPELTYGLPGHTDPNAITILLQDDVPGLQVLHDGKWVTINPIPFTFIVNIGDQIQVISNDRYKSVLHRAVVNSEKERFSIPTFYCPSYDAVIEPARELVHNGYGEHQQGAAAYRSFTYAEFYEKFWKRGLRSESCLDAFKAFT